MDNDTAAPPLGGYALTGHREAGGDETPRFEVYLTLHGVRVLRVSNDRHGGSHVYRPGPLGAGFREAPAAFEAYAREWNAGHEFAGIEDGDALVYHLIEVAVLNRKRTVVYLLDDEDCFKHGVAHQALAGVTYEQTHAYLAENYPGRNARVWGKARSEFVPVEG